MGLSNIEKQTVIKKANNYIKWEKEEHFRDEVALALQEEAFDELYERFYTTLTFGTAGMRGVIGGGTNRINPFMIVLVTQAFANYLRKEIEKPTVVIAYDSRNYSKLFAKKAALTLCANGIKVFIYDEIRPVPMLSFALRYLKADAGLVITASHNPAKYNGYKVYWSHGGQVTAPHDEAIVECVKRVKAEEIKSIAESKAQKEGLLATITTDVDNAYYALVEEKLINKALFNTTDIKVAYTPLHGAGNKPLSSLLDRFNISYDIVKEQQLPDGDFPTVAMPNPEDPQAMRLALELAVKNGADIVLGTDPDADRLGIAIPSDPTKKSYTLLNGNQIAVLLVDYLINNKKDNRIAVVIKSLVTTDLVKEIVEKRLGVCLDVLTGFKYIAEKIEELQDSEEKFFLFGCEESFGYLFLEQIRDKDAISSAMLAVEMVAYYKANNISLQDRLDAIYNEFGFFSEKVLSYSYEGVSGVEKMAQIMASFRSLRTGSTFANNLVAHKSDLLNDKNTNLPPSDVIILKFESGDKIVVRPSGTEPKIKYYLFFKSNGESKEAFEKLVQSKTNQLKSHL
ncbi:MAG: phospho-sugar mutase [Sphaerochaetaceae bacterium]